MMPAKIIALLLLNLQGCRGECFHVLHGRGTIQSPHYENEYKEKANCSWEIPGKQNYAVLLQLVSLKIFNLDIQENRKECDDSYKLVINGEAVDCKMYIRPGFREDQMCYVIPHQTCQHGSGFQGCLEKNKSNQVTVQYIADGSRSSGNRYSSFMYGFQMKYSSEPCQGEDFDLIPPAGSPTIIASRTAPPKVTTHTPSRTRTPTMTRIGRRTSTPTSIPKDTPISAKSTQGADSQATVRQPPTSASSTQSVEATAGSDSSAIAGGIIGILVVIALGAAILYFLKRRQMINGQLQPRDGAHRSQQATDDMYAAIGENGATGASAVAYRARDQNTAVTQENVLYGTTSYPFDQSYAEPSDTSTQVAYAQVDRSAKRRGRQPNDGAASPPPSRSGADLYAVVKKDRAPAPDTAD